MQGANASRKEIEARVGKRQWLAVLSKIADCARASVLVKRLGSQSAGNVAGVREALVARADDDKGVSQGDLAETNDSVSQVNLPEITPLMRACKEGDEPCVLALLEAGVDVDEASPGSCCTALHYAALSGDEACVRALIKEGANVNHPCNGGFTALFMACGNEYDQIVTALLDANADPLRVGGHAGLGFGLGFALGFCSAAETQLPFFPRVLGAEQRKALREQRRVPVPWSREGHAGFPKPRREQAVALVRAGATLCLATHNPSAFRDAWNEYVMETYLPGEIPPLSREEYLPADCESEDSFDLYM